jgi:hypothetical protein
MAEETNPDQSETRRQLEDVSKSISEIALTLKQRGNDKPRDKWDKFNALSPFVTGLIVAIVGGLFTFSQDQRNDLLKQQEINQSNWQATQDAVTKDHQARILELQTIAQLMPYLISKNEKSKQVAITAINELASTSLAVQLAKLNQSPGTINAVRQIAAQSLKEGDRKIAQAALVELERPNGGPNKTLLKTEEGDCGPEGIGGDNATNLLKNRTDVPTIVRDVTPQDLEKLEALKVPLRRDAWTSEDIGKAKSVGDGLGIRVQGYLLRVRRQGRTSSNCESAGYVDWHLIMGPSPDTALEEGVVAVVGPRIRISHPNWTLERLDELATTRVPVRVSGWLFFAQYHLIGPWNYKTLWQVTPAVKIEFLKNQAWLDLDDVNATPN